MAAQVVGIVLAAGAGRRMGQPKALVADERGGWLVRAVEALRSGGCWPVIVVLGAQAEAAAKLLPAVVPPPPEPHAAERHAAEANAVGGQPTDESVGDDDIRVVVAADWAQGMGASLRAGLQAAEDTTAAAALITLVDLPDVGAEVVARMLAQGCTAQQAEWRGLARAAYRGVPGHPVLVGREHWPAAREAAQGDQGARGLFASTDHLLVECGDLAGGADVDTRPPGA